MLTWLTEASCLYAGPTQSSNNELIRRYLQIFFFSEKTKSTRPAFRIICGKTLTYQRVVPKTQYCRVRYTLNSLHLSSHKSYFYLNFRILSGTHNLFYGCRFRCKLSLPALSIQFKDNNVPVNSKTAHSPPGQSPGI